MVALPQYTRHGVCDRQVCSRSMSKLRLVPGRELHQWMGRAKLKGQDRIPEIMPVDDEPSIAQKAR